MGGINKSVPFFSVAVLLDVAEYEAMQEKIELLEDVQTSVAQIDSGKGIEHGKLQFHTPSAHLI